MYSFIVKVDSKPTKGNDIRFSIVVKEEENVVMELEGWRIRNYNTLLSPNSWGRDGRMYTLVHLPNLAWQQKIMNAVLKIVDPDESKRYMAEKREEEL